MIIEYFEIPELYPRDESSVSAIIRIQCILKTFDVKSQTLFITKYSLSVSYSHFFTKIRESFYIIVDCIREFSFIDILVGFTCDEEKYRELFFRSKYILDRRVESVDKYFYRHIPSLINLAKKCIIK